MNVPRWLDRVRDESGAAIIEFALVVPLLLTVAWGIIETARAFYTVNSLASAVRDGARFGAATCPVSRTTGGPDISACSAAIDSVVLLAFQPLGGALQGPQVDAFPLGSGSGTRIQVVANYPYTPIVPVRGWRFTLTRRAAFRYERLP